MKNLICDLICSGRRRTVTRAGAGFVGLVLATLVAQPAYADCTPASASGVTAACTGATTNQGGGAPGTSAANNGYGTGAETGITVNVAAGATVTGNAAASSSGIFINNGTITNGSGATISGVLFAIRSDTVTVTNSGTVAGTGAGFGDGIYGASSLNVTNNAGAAITGWDTLATDGKATVRNFGTITSTGNFGIASGTADVINYAGATITAGAYGVYGHDGITVTNSGTITGTRIAGVVLVSGLATVTNLSGGIITGTNGIAADGRVNVTNSGTIASATVPFSGDGISARSGIVTNNAGATISGLLYGISFNFPDGGSSVYNAGFIDGGTASAAPATR